MSNGLRVAKQHPFVIIDKILDFVPYVSTASNAVILLSKVALAVFKKIKPNHSFHSHPIAVHIKNKNTLTCILLMIPIVNCFVALDIHRSKRNDVPPPAMPYRAREKSHQISTHTSVFVPATSVPFDTTAIMKQENVSSEETLKQVEQIKATSKQGREERKQERLEDDKKWRQKLVETIANPASEEQRKKAEILLEQHDKVVKAREDACDALYA